MQVPSIQAGLTVLLAAANRAERFLLSSDQRQSAALLFA
jgi:hypothetical protein